MMIDQFATAVCEFTYIKNKNLDFLQGLIHKLEERGGVDIDILREEDRLFFQDLTPLPI